jgi:CRP-like cAMP-binding protein
MKRDQVFQYHGPGECFGEIQHLVRAFMARSLRDANVPSARTRHIIFVLLELRHLIFEPYQTSAVKVWRGVSVVRATVG